MLGEQPRAGTSHCAVDDGEEAAVPLAGQRLDKL